MDSGSREKRVKDTVEKEDWALGWWTEERGRQLARLWKELPRPDTLPTTT